MIYKKASFYFMSGTGNSYRVATWLDEAAKEAGINSAIHSLDRGYKAEKVTEGSEELIGLIMPTHGFTAPWPMLRFVLSLPRVKGTHAIIIPTRGGTKIGPFCFPGLQGTAGYLLALLLTLKGYAVRGVIGIDMPSNWTSFHWGINLANSKVIIARAKAKTLKFIKPILSGKSNFNGFIELIIGLMILPVSIGYLLYARISFAKMFFASDKCNGCGLCAVNCPQEAVIMIGEKPYWTYKCESCMRCMNFCPTKAVEVSHPLAVGVFYLSGIPVADYLLNKVGNAMPQLGFLKNGLTIFLIQYFYFVTSICLVYVGFSMLNRIPVISRLFKVFTLTHYYRRYHEPDTKVKDLTFRGGGKDD